MVFINSWRLLNGFCYFLEAGGCMLLFSRYFATGLPQEGDCTSKKFC